MKKTLNETLSSLENFDKKIYIDSELPIMEDDIEEILENAKKISFDNYIKDAASVFENKDVFIQIIESQRKDITDSAEDKKLKGIILEADKEKKWAKNLQDLSINLNNEVLNLRKFLEMFDYLNPKNEIQNSDNFLTALLAMKSKNQTHLLNLRDSENKLININKFLNNSSNSNIKDNLIDFAIGVIIALDARDDLTYALTKKRISENFYNYVKQREFLNDRNIKMKNNYVWVEQFLPKHIIDKGQTFVQETMILLHCLFSIKDVSVLQNEDLIDIIMENNFQLPMEVLYSEPYNREDLRSIITTSLKEALENYSDIITSKIRNYIELIEKQVVKMSTQGSKTTFTKNDLSVNTKLAKQIIDIAEGNSNNQKIIVLSNPLLQEDMSQNLDLSTDGFRGVGFLIKEDNEYVKQLKDRGYLNYIVYDQENKDVFIFDEQNPTKSKWIPKDHVFISSKTLERNDLKTAFKKRENIEFIEQRFIGEEV